MKLQKKTIVLLCLTWVVAAILFASCTSPTSQTRTELSPTSTMISIHTATLPGYTITPTAGFSVGFSPSPISTPTAVPALPEEQAQAKLLELLANNGNCRLPCLWGITPGKSLFHEAWAVLSLLGSLSSSTNLSPNLGSIEPHYIEGNLNMFSRVSFLTDKNIVKSISFNAQEKRKDINKDKETIFFDVFDSASFGKRARPYMLSQILSEQGIPAAVVISTFNSPIIRGNIISGGFHILLLYPDQGLLAHYTTQMHLVEEKILGCPANAHVELELYPSGQGDSYSEFLSQTQWAKLWPVPTDSPYWKPVEKATSMSLEQFYETFRASTNKCIETSAKIWPPTEQ